VNLASSKLIIQIDEQRMGQDDAELMRGRTSNIACGRNLRFLTALSM
jgi:hypothetical protein